MALFQCKYIFLNIQHIKALLKQNKTYKPCECVGDVTRLWQRDWWDCDFVLVEGSRGFSSEQIDPRAICFSVIGVSVSAVNYK